MNQAPPSALTPGYPQPGEVLDGKYEIEKMLGEGGMGAVAKATHLLRRAPVALKFMNPMFLPMQGAIERFRNEGVAASQLDSDHVVHIYDVGALPSGAPYLVMEYLEGCDLAQLLARDGRPGLPIGRAIHFMLQILRGLQAAHAKGIVHRDMKPSNCFVVHKDGEDDFVKLLDFGISKVRQPGGASLTQTNSALGTPLYMSPEQARSPRDVNQRSDIYSAGVILYELFTGKTPFFSESGEFTEILFKLFTSEPPPVKTLRSDLPDGLAAVVHHALARDQNARFSDTLAMAEALAPYAAPETAPTITRMRNVALPPGSRAVPSFAGPAPSIALRPPPQSAAAPGEHAVSHAHEVLAATLGVTGDGFQTADRPAQAAGLRTDLGASRDAEAPAPAKKKSSGATAWMALGAVVMLGVLVTVGVVVKAQSRTNGTATAETSAPLPTNARPPPLPSAPVVVPTVTASAPPTDTALTAPVDASLVSPPLPTRKPKPPGDGIRRNPDGKPCAPGTTNPCMD